MSISSLDDRLSDRRFLNRQRSRSTFYQSHAKRAFDLVLLLSVAPFVLPVLIFCILAVAMNGGRPIYSQRRVGRNGAEFRCYKIRTMVHNADQVLDQLLSGDPRLAAQWERNQKLVNDPRITSLGRILRKTSLDELPQLWNVLKGEMSFVGARPFLPGQKDVYDHHAKTCAYYLHRPGLTGLWQVGCRNDGDFADRVAKDDHYFRKLTFWTDFRILAKTGVIVLKATGR